MKKLSVSLKESRFVDLINKKFYKDWNQLTLEHLFCGQMMTYVLITNTYSHLMK